MYYAIFYKIKKAENFIFLILQHFVWQTIFYCNIFAKKIIFTFLYIFVYSQEVSNIKKYCFEKDSLIFRKMTLVLRQKIGLGNICYTE